MLDVSKHVTLSGVLQNLFTDKVLDLIVLLFNFYVYICKWQEAAPNLNAFLRILEERYTVERHLHIISDETHNLNTEWLFYIQSIARLPEFVLTHFYTTYVWAQFATMFILNPNNYVKNM